MDNFFHKLSRVMRKGNLYMILICVLVLVIALAGLYYALFGKNNAGVPQPSATPGEPTTAGDTLLVEDIRSGQIEIPRFDIPINNYAPNKTEFGIENGFITYTGESYLGIDVSSHQGVIDWAAVKASGIEFAMIRAAYRGTTLGKLYTDTQFEANMQGAKDNGIQIGVYIFSQATSVAEADEEAAYVLGLIAPHKDTIKYPVVFDWEIAGGDNVRTTNVKAEVVTAAAQAFCTKIDKAGYKTMVYMNKSMGYDLYDLKAIEKYPIWIAEYEARPSFYYNFDIWQYTDSGTVGGINGTVDVNLSFKNYG